MTLRSKAAKSHCGSGRRAAGRPGARRQWRSPSWPPVGDRGVAGPLARKRNGILALAAPISSAGCVLSQPPSSTTASKGWARSVSSTSIASRLRNGNEVGLMMFSLSDISGISNGTPPASRMPVRTSSANARKLRLHGLMSDQVFRMPMAGRVIRSSRLHPAAASVERWTKPGRSSLRNQRALRSGRL